MKQVEGIMFFRTNQVKENLDNQFESVFQNIQGELQVQDTRLNQELNELEYQQDQLQIYQPRRSFASV